MIRPGLSACALALLIGVSGVQAADLTIGLQEDPDVLDPDQSRTFVGRIVYAALCDKLVDITPELEIVPMLATGWTTSEDGLKVTMDLREGVTFHDGTAFDAEAVRANIERSTTLPESRRKSELASVEKVEVTGPYQVAFTLKGPDATFLSQLADRAGMMISPTAAAEKGLDFGLEPICSGPFSFVERVQQDRIVLEKFEGYYDAGNVFIDKVTFLPIPDTTVRLANLRAGDLDMLERLAATDVASVEAEGVLQIASAVSLGYQGITNNIANGERAQNPYGQDKRIRQALELSIDRDAINQVVFEGAFAPGNQPFAPTSPWYNKDIPIPARDVAKARALLQEAGHERLELEVQVANNPVQMQLMQVVQSMAAEAGFDIKLKSMEFASLLQDQSAGNYEASQIGWSGRVDPDGNLHQFVTCEGGINDSKHCNPVIDDLLDRARTATTFEERKALYGKASAILAEDLPIIYLYHQTWIWALAPNVEGFVPYPDGMIRLQGVKLN